MFEKYKDTMTVNEVCEALGIGKNNVYTLLKKEIIKSIKIGKKYVIPKICLIDYIYKYRNS